MVNLTGNFCCRVRKIFGLNHWLDKQEELLKNLDWSGCALDAGCGSFDFAKKFADDKTKKVINLDIEITQKYPCSLAGDLHSLPFADNQFDLVFCRFVMEHVHTPEKVFAEFARVTKPDGYLVILIPNRYSLSGLASSLTPTWVHNFWRQRILASYENAPTYYRANTVSKVEKLLAGQYRIMELTRCDGWSSYFRFAKSAYVFGVICERFLSVFQVNRQSFWILGEKTTG